MNEQELELQRKADELVRREVYYCASQLVDALRGMALDPEEEETLWSLSTQTVYVPYSDEHGEGEEFSSEDDAQDWIDEQEGADDWTIEERTHEAYEHWIVSDWLGRQLGEAGEMVGDLLGLTLWGRCTTGQAISLDGVIRGLVR